ncbi:MAG: Xaa-Pro peptidase family protein, partial [Thermoplasmata archaeon]|nr:Xaa-Pro peptidase family protein [Thermoplasmata archaeon]
IFPEEAGRSMLDWIVGELKKENWLTGKIGVEMWSYRPNRAVSEMFQKKLEKNRCRVIDGTDIVRGLRTMKSPKEIEYTEKAARIADIGMRAAIETVKAGMTELEVYGEIIKVMAKAGGENPAITLPVSSGKKSACMHALSSRKRIAKGDIVNIDICGVYNRYHANMARTLSIGNAHPAVKKVVQSSAGSFDLIRKMITPNLSVEDMMNSLKAYYEKTGIEKNNLWYGGYELGIAFPPDWVGSFAYDAYTDQKDRLFVPGTVINYESNFFLPRRAGASLQINTIIFTEREAKLLGEIQNDLIVV